MQLQLSFLDAPPTGVTAVWATLRDKDRIEAVEKLAMMIARAAATGGEEEEEEDNE